MEKKFQLLVPLLVACCSSVWAGTSDDTVIAFLDDNVKTICVSNWDNNNDGELSMDEAAVVTSLGSVFSDNNVIVSFNELRYFTGLTAIDEYAFTFCTSLKSVTLPANITVIGASAFDGCSSLQTIELPPLVEQIGEWAFNGCSSVESLSLPSSVVSIGEYAFGDCSSLSNLSFEEGLEILGDGVFQNCSSLTSIILPATVNTIGWGAFYNCENITSVTVFFNTPIPVQGATFSSREKADLIVPAGCLDSFSTANIWREFKSISEMADVGVQFADEAVKTVCVESFDLNGDGELSMTELSQVSSLGNVFKNNTVIRSFDELRYFTGLTTLPSYTFQGCTALQSITLPQGVITIGDDVFHGCVSLTSIDVVENHPAFASVDGVLFNDDLTTLVLYPIAKGTSYIIPEGTLRVGHNAFSNSLLASVTFPSTLLTLEEEAFSQNGNLHSVVLNEGFTTLADGAFFMCSHLKEITLPSSLQSLGNMVFALCPEITDINCLMVSPAPIAYNNFDSEVYDNAVLHVSMDMDYIYGETESWSSFLNIEDDLNRIDAVMSVFVDDIEIYEGGRKQIVVSLNNGDALLNGYKFDLVLPEGFTLAKDDDDNYLFTLSDRYTDKDKVQISITSEIEGVFNIECHTLGGETLLGSDGPILSLTIQADEELFEDCFIANIFNFTCNYIYGATFGAENFFFNIFASGFAMGDVNHDTLVNVADVMLIVNYVLGRTQTLFHSTEADVNDDGFIDVADAMVIVKRILNNTANMPEMAYITKLDGLHTSGHGDFCLLSVDDISSYSAFQMKVSLPEGASLRNVELSEESSNGHSVKFNRLEDGSYNVVVFNLNGKMFRDNTGHLLRFTIDGASADELRMSEIQFTNANFETVGFSDVETLTDGIDTVTEHSDDTPVYNLQGQKTNARTRGIYIKNGKKIILK